MKQKDKKRFVSVCTVTLLVFSQSMPIFAQTIQSETEQIVNSSENLMEEPESNLEEPPSEEKNTALEEPKAPEAPVEVLAEEEPSAPFSEGTDSIMTGTWGTAPWRFDEATGVLTIESGDLGFSNNAPWIRNVIEQGSIKKIVLTGLIIAPENSKSLFLNLWNLEGIERLDRLDTSNVTTMEQMFTKCSSLKNLDVSGLDTSNVINMSRMFNDCAGLTNVDMSGFDTSNVINMSRMFNDCAGLTNVNMSGFDTSNVIDMSYMFTNCNSLTNIDMSGFDTSNVTNMYQMFTNCSSLKNLDVSEFYTSNVTNMYQMFTNCSSLKNLDVSGFDTSNVSDMNYMFSKCSSLTSLDVSGFDTSNVIGMGYMFFQCSSLTSLDVSGFDTSNVTGSMGYMFSKCSSLTSLNVSRFDTSNVTNMYQMFSQCSRLTSLDVSGFDTNKVTSVNMSYMFSQCSNLTSLDVSGFDTSNVTGMSYMFSQCSSLSSLDVSGFDTSNVTRMDGMFSKLKLTKLTLGDKFKFQKNAGLGAPNITEGFEKENWIREDGKSKSYSPIDFMEKYGTGDLTAGSYVAEAVPMASLKLEIKFNENSGEAIVGDKIETTVTITHSKDSENESIATKMSVDVTNIHSDSVVLIENLDSKGEMIKTSQQDLVDGKLTLDNLNHGESYVLYFEGTAWNNVPKLDLWAYSVALSYFDGYDSMYTKKSGNFEVLSGPFGFSEVPELLTFNDTKLSDNVKEQLVDRQEKDWSISLEDYRGTNSVSEPEAEPLVDRVDWEMTATYQGFKDSKGDKLLNGSLGVIFQKAGDSKELTAQETLIESHSVAGETPKDKHSLKIFWEETEGFKAIVHNRNGLKTEVDYKAQLDFELRVAP